MKVLKKLQWGLGVLAVFVGANAAAQYIDTSVRDRIYAAASAGNIGELQRLASLGYSLDLKDANGNTAYCQAVWAQNRTAVATLISAGVDVRPGCLRRIPYVTETRIYAAAHAEDLEQLVAWKKEGLNVDVVNPKTGNSALCEAVYNYDCPAIQTLLRVGSQQAQSCMRRVPQEIREKLQCRPLKIDWTTVGYTVLGVGMAGALVAILGSNGGNGTPTCAEDQRWNGDKCVSCDTCWIGTTCISSADMKKKPYYRDEKTAECWTVAPPPVKLSEKEMEEAVEEIESDTRYTRGNYLPMINAAEAYAKGYTGYMVERTSPYGRPANGTTNTPQISDKKVTVAVYSDGINIGEGGTITSTTTSSTTTSTTQTKTEVWNFDSVNKAFYNSMDSKATAYRDQQYTIGSGTSTSNKTGTYVAKVGTVETNLATSNDKPYGYNYDYGQCQSESGSVVKKNCYYGEVVTLKEEGKEDTKVGFAAFYQGTTTKYVLMNPTTGMITGLTTTKPVHCATNTKAECYQNYARWSGLPDVTPGTDDTTGSINNIVFDKLNYVDYTYDEKNPNPHYRASGGASSLTGSTGTFVGGIIGAMKLDDPMLKTYGVAYNVSLLPVNRDVVRGLGLSAMTAMTSNADVIVSTETHNVNDNLEDPSVMTALGGFTKNSDGSYTAKEVAAVLGADALSMYKLLAQDGKGKVMVVANGNGQSSDKWKIKQPTIQSGVPLYKGLNSGTTWNPTSNVLPTVDSTNPLYHLYITAGSIDNITYDANGKAESATLSAYSQPCGIAGSYCLMAPGGQSLDSARGVYSTTDPTMTGDSTGYSYMYNYGTSASAAVVGGAVALLMSAYPHLTAQQVVEILFQTATYIPATDAQRTAYGDTYGAGSDSYGDFNSIFGRGLINLAAATEPIGGKNGLWVYKNNGSAVGDGSGVVVKASATRLVAPASLTTTSALSSALPSNFVAFDAYNRPFQLPTAGLFTLKNRRKTKSWDDFKMFMQGRDPVKLQPTENFSMMYRNQTHRVNSSSQIPMGLVQMNLKQNKMRYSLFYSQDTTMGKEAYWKRRLSNPFIQMRDAYGVETGYDLNSKWSVEVGWTTGRNGFFDDDDRRFDAPDNKMQAFTSSLVYKPIDKVSFKVATGVMKETGSSLGMVSEGAFNIKGASTHFVGAGVAFTPMDKVRLEAMYYYGQTKTNSNGGLMNLSRLTSDSFAVTASYQPTEEHLFGLQVSSPLRVRKGTMNVTLPVGRHETEDIYYYETYKANMKPKARELDMSMYYQGNVTDEVSLQSEMGVRLNPDHQADVAPDYRGMVGVKWEY